MRMTQKGLTPPTIPIYIAFYFVKAIYIWFEGSDPLFWVILIFLSKKVKTFKKINETTKKIKYSEPKILKYYFFRLCYSSTYIEIKTTRGVRLWITKRFAVPVFLIGLIDMKSTFHRNMKSFPSIGMKLLCTFQIIFT